VLTKIKELVTKVRDFTLTAKEKAAVAAVVTFLSNYLTQNGLTWKDLLTWSALHALAWAAVAHVCVWFVANSKARS
jgi:hypothetical protein